MFTALQIESWQRFDIEKKYGKSSLFNLSRPGEVFVINAHGTPTKKKIREGNYSLKSLSQAL